MPSISQKYETGLVIIGYIIIQYIIETKVAVLNVCKEEELSLFLRFVYIRVVYLYCFYNLITDIQS